VIAVVVTNSAEADALAAALLPSTGRIVREADRTYRFYQCDRFTCRFTDVDGDVLLEARSFTTVARADAWVAEHARQRHAVMAAAGRAQ
jgi:hypothetical protein